VNKVMYTIWWWYFNLRQPWVWPLNCIYYKAAYRSHGRPFL